MRRVLVLGGTGWLGRAIVRSLLATGARVTCLARGESGDVPAGARLIRADRRLPGAYDEVISDWDEVIEIAYEPELVRPALDVLAHRAAHWTLVSSISVYSHNDEPGADESAAVVNPDDLAQYPDAKVAAERASSQHLGDRLLTARPGLIVGAGDPSDRFGYWPARFSRRGSALTPTTAGRLVQVIDIADLARWIALAGCEMVTGSINAVGAVHQMADFFRLTADTAGHADGRIELDDETLVGRDVRYWAGPRALPLWLPPTDTAMMQRDGQRYLETGGHLTPIERTITAVLEDERLRGLTRPRRSGLTPPEERAVLDSVG